MLDNEFREIEQVVEIKVNVAFQETHGLETRARNLARPYVRLGPRPPGPQTFLNRRH